MNKYYGYKAVCRERDGQLSSLNGMYRGQLKYYELNKWSNPSEDNNPFLFVFDTQENAQYFADSLIPNKDCVFEVYRAEIRKPFGKAKATLQRLFVTGKHGDAYTHVYDTKSFARGTLFTKGVKLLERVGQRICQKPPQIRGIMPTK